MLVRRNATDPISRLIILSLAFKPTGTLAADLLRLPNLSLKLTLGLWLEPVLAVVVHFRGTLRCLLSLGGDNLGFWVPLP